MTDRKVLELVLAKDREMKPQTAISGEVHIAHECGVGWDERENIRVCRRTYDNGSENLWLQCTKCGKGRAIRRTLWDELSELPPWENIREATWEKNRSEYESRVAAEKAEQDRKRSERRAFYLSYLRTPQWAGRREKVMRRARRVCEACGEAQADQVHHTTYLHLGNEPLWGLRAVCRKCHERIHGIDPESAIDL